MKDRGSQVGRGLWLRWVVASTVGLYAGWIMAFVLLAFSGIVLGLGDCETCDVLASLIGLGIGIGVLQWLVLRRRVSGAGWWILASIAGGYGILQAGFSGYTESVEMSFASLLGLAGVSALSGAAAGILQWLILRGQVSRAGWWILASAVGWGLGIALSRGITANDFVAVGLTGVVLGAVTGGALVWLLGQPEPEV